MSTLSPKDRASLCSFTFADGRRCRTPRTGNHPHFCFYHAQKEARARTAETLGRDVAYFFSGNYLSACDLSTALGRLIPAVVRGDIKPRAARTVAYLAQTLVQTIHISQHEYCEAFSSDAWRKSIRNSVNYNHDYRFPSAPKPEQPAPSALRTHLRSQSPQPQPFPPQTQPPASAPPPNPSQPAATPVNCHSERSEESASSSNSSLAAHHSPLPQAPSPHTPLPPTSAEFVRNVVAGLQAGQRSSPPPRASQRSTQDSSPATANSAAPNHASPSSTTPPSPKATPSSPSAPLSPTVATSPAPPQPQAQPPSPQPACPDQGRRVNPREPDRSAPWLDFTRSIPPDSKLL